MTFNSPLVAHFYAMQYRISASTRIQRLQLHFDNGGHPRSLWFCIRGSTQMGINRGNYPAKMTSVLALGVSSKRSFDGEDRHR